MRSSGFVCVASFIIIIVMGILMVTTMRSSYMDSLTDKVDDGVVYAMHMLETDRDLLDYSDFEQTLVFTEEGLSRFQKSFVQYVTNILGESSDAVHIDFYAADEIRGIISVKVTVDFTYPFGAKDSVSTYKTVILDKYLKIDRNSYAE